MKKVVTFWVFLFFIGLINAQLNIDYDLVGDKALVEISSNQVKDLEIRIPYDARTIESNSDYSIIDFDSYKIVRVAYAEDFKFSYITNSVIDYSKMRNYFIFNNYFNDSLNIELSLPEGAVLEHLVFPDSDEIITDGRNIILKWNNFDGEDIVVSYKNIQGSNDFWFYLLILLIIGFSIFYIYQAKKLKRKIIKIKSKQIRTKESKKKDVTRNLFREEKKIIEYLFDKKGHSSWTKEIVRDLGISKVRLSRKLRNLVQKGLIEKIPHGNENRIRLLKTH